MRLFALYFSAILIQYFHFFWRSVQNIKVCFLQLCLGSALNNICAVRNFKICIFFAYFCEMSLYSRVPAWSLNRWWKNRGAKWWRWMGSHTCKSWKQKGGKRKQRNIFSVGRVHLVLSETDTKILTYNFMVEKNSTCVPKQHIRVCSNGDATIIYQHFYNQMRSDRKHKLDVMGCVNQRRRDSNHTETREATWVSEWYEITETNLSEIIHTYPCFLWGCWGRRRRRRRSSASRTASFEYGILRILNRWDGENMSRWDLKRTHTLFYPKTLRVSVVSCNFICAVKECFIHFTQQESCDAFTARETWNTAFFYFNHKLLRVIWKYLM